MYKYTNDKDFLRIRQITFANLDFSQVNKAITLIKASLSRKNKILICGNGGSAAQAEHLATEFIVRYKSNLRKPIPAISLNSDVSLITAHSNDFTFDTVFNNQISSLGNKNDLLLVFTTSGKSKNILNALKVAKKNHLKIIGFTGTKQNNFFSRNCDIVINIGSKDTAIIQEAHLILTHYICEILDNFK